MYVCIVIMFAIFCLEYYNHVESLEIMVVSNICLILVFFFFFYKCSYCTNFREDIKFKLKVNKKISHVCH